MRVLPVPFLLCFALGCPDGSGTDDTSGGKDSSDTGDTGNVDLGPPGCINLNGTEGDFATISEALEYTAPGDTVNVCGGSYSEQVAVPEGVAIVGEGSTTTLIDAPINESAFDFTGAGGSVSGFTITSTRSGITLDGASDVTITDVVFDAPANYGIESVNSTGLTVTASTFNLPAFGGVYVAGGTATIDSSVFTEPTSYGVWAASDAVVTVSNNTFSMVHATVDDLSDGHAVFADASEVTMSHNVIDANDLVGVWSEGGALSMDGDVIRDTPYSVINLSAGFSATGVEVYGAMAVGMFISTKGDVSVTDTVVDLNGGPTTGLTSCSVTYDDWSGVCGGLLVAADTATLTGVTVAGYENYGIYMEPGSNNGTVAATLQDITLDDNGRWSLRLVSAEATIDGLTVTNHREPDENNADPCYGYIDRATAAVFTQSEVAVTNSLFDTSAGWAVSYVLSNGSVSNSSIVNSACAGIINYQGSVEVTGNTFGPNGSFGGVFDYQAATVVEGNSFVDTAQDSISEYDDGAGGTYRYINSGGGRDILFSSSTACLIKDNVFSGGDMSLDLELTGCTVTGNSWTDYGGTVVSVYQGDSSDPVVISGNTADNIAGTVVDSSYGYAEVEDFQIGTTLVYEYSYASWFIASDGTETLQYSYSYSYGQPVFRAYGYHYGYWSDTDGDGVSDTYTEYGYSSGLSLTNVNVESAYETVVEASEGALDISDLTVSEAGSYGVYASWSYYAPEVEIAGLDLGSTASAGVWLDANTADAGYAELSDVTIDVSGGAGVQVTGFAEVTLDGVEVIDAAGYGVYTSGEFSYYDYETSTTVSGSLEPLVELTDVVVSGSTYDGITITNGTPVLDTCSAASGDSNGLTLTSTTAEVVDSSFTGNAGYGMQCVSTTLSVCSGNVLDGNTAGAHLDCSDDCTL